MAHRYGIHGDYLKDGKLDLPELLDSSSTDDWACARDFIRRRRWQEAVTYRETAPHQYTVRKRLPDEASSADFDRFVILTHRFGYADFYYQIRHLYWAVDEFKYWTMGWPVSETTVINRARLDAVEPWRSQSGPASKGFGQPVPVGPGVNGSGDDALAKQAPFSRHPDVGLVGMTDADLQIELEQLVVD